MVCLFRSLKLCRSAVVNFAEINVCECLFSEGKNGSPTSKQNWGRNPWQPKMNDWYSYTFYKQQRGLCFNWYVQAINDKRFEGNKLIDFRHQCLLFFLLLYCGIQTQSPLRVIIDYFLIFYLISEISFVVTYCMSLKLMSNLELDS